MDFLLFGLLAYVLGSIPTSVWVGRAWYGMDIRQHGSKNAGATNTFRVLGKKAGIVVLSVDIVKGFLATFLPFVILPLPWKNEHLIQVQLIAAIAAVIGHVLPLFAGFKGGKGVATSLGVVIGIHPPAAGICVLIFLVTFIVSQYVSLGAIISAVAFPFIVRFVFGNTSIYLTIFTIVLSLLVIYAHKKNIGRLIRGNENKMNLFHRKA